MSFNHLIGTIKGTVLEGVGSIMSKPITPTKSTSVKKPAKPVVPERPSPGATFGGGMVRPKPRPTVGLRESLKKEIKAIAKDKNCKCKKEKGENPKGTPDGFELNPEITSSVQNR